MYKEIIVDTTTEGSDFVADAFFSIGVSGVKIVDKNDINELTRLGFNWDYIDDELLNNRDKIAKVSGFVSQEECEAKIVELKENLDAYRGIGVDLGTLEISVSDYVDGDWLTEWKKYYKPIPVGDFVIVPEWQEYDNSKDERIIIKIDPSMAFGTGEHETTRLCLELMSGMELKDKNVLDVGTGSGILGIAAAKKGARPVNMIDIDSLSIKSAKENSELNSVTECVTIEEADLVSKTDVVADVVLANLTADILIRLSKDLKSHLKKGGVVIASGIIHARKAEIIKEFNERGFILTDERTDGEWDALRFRG